MPTPTSPRRHISRHWHSTNWRRVRRIGKGLQIFSRFPRPIRTGGGDMLKTGLGAAAVGAIAGAAIAIAVIFAAAALGILPPGSDARIHAYLLNHPQVLVEVGNKLQAQQDAKEDGARERATR